MSITPAQVEQAYRVAKKVKSDEMTVGDARKYLHSNYSLNAGSAQTFIYVFRDMLNGVGFKRGLAQMPTRYYLTHILADYGKSILSQALTALMGHIVYYENRRRISMNGLRNIHSDFSDML